MYRAPSGCTHHTSPDLSCQAQVDTDAPSAAGYEHSLRLVLSVVQQVWNSYPCAAGAPFCCCAWDEAFPSDCALSAKYPD